MTDTQHNQTTGPRMLRRSRDQRMFAGVAGGLGEHLGISAWWFRIAFFVLAFAGGAGVLLYILGWIFLPDADEDQSAAARWLSSIDMSDTGTVIGVVLIGASAIYVASQVFSISGSLIVAAVMFAAGLILYRGEFPGRGSTDRPDPRDEGDPPDDAGPPDEDAATDADPAPSSTDTVVGGVPVVAASSVADGQASTAKSNETQTKAPRRRRARPKREPSILGRLTIAIAIIVLSLMALIEASGISIGSADSGEFFDPVHYAATGLAIISIGLIIGAFIGRARWLIAVALLSLPFVFVSSVWPSSFAWTADDQFFEPQQVEDLQSEYVLGVGRLEVSLLAFTPEELAELGRLDLSLGAGEVRVLIPDDVGVWVDASTGLGQVTLSRQRYEPVDGEPDGFSPTFTQVDRTTEGINARMNRSIGPSPHDFVLEIEVGAGQIDVRTVEGLDQ